MVFLFACAILLLAVDNLESQEATANWQRAGLEAVVSEANEQAVGTALKVFPSEIWSAGSEGVAIGIGEALADTDSHVRQAAADALGQLGEAAAGQAERLGEALTDTDARVRYAAAEALGQLGEAAAGQAEHLVNAILTDTDFDVRYAATEALGQLGEAAAGQAERLGEALADTDASVRQAAARALGQLGEAAAGQAERLGEALTDTDARVRQAAADALGQLGEAAAGQAERLVTATLTDTDAGMRYVAAQALDQLGEAAAGQFDRLGEALADTDARVRYAAAEALGELGEAAAGQAERLGEALADTDESVRKAAARALGQLGEAAAGQAERLGEALTDTDESVRKAAADALGQLGEAAAGQAERLGKALTDTDARVRQAAAKALGRLGDATPGQVLRLGETLTDTAMGVRYEAVRALGQLGEAAAGQAERLVNAILTDTEWVVRRAAAGALGQLGEAAYAQAERLVNAILTETDSGTRYVAVDALRKLGEAAAGQADRLGEALTDTDARVRQAAAEALGQLGEAAAGQADRLGGALTDTEWSVRQAAAEALGQLGEAAAGQAERLGEALADTDASVRQAAARALGQLGEAAAGQAERLGEALTDTEWRVRQAAAEALGQLGEAAAGQVERLVNAALTDADDDVRLNADFALLQVGSSDRTNILTILDHAAGRRNLALELRLWARYLAGEQMELQLLIDWLGRPQAPPIVGIEQDYSQALTTLVNFKDVWPLTNSLKDLRPELANRIVKVVESRTWTAQDVSLLEDLRVMLKEGNSNIQASAIEDVVATIRPNRIFQGVIYLWGAHAVLWILLIFFYPWSRPVQSFFFWNKWVRWFVGFGYVGVLLAWVPFLRRRLFQPFRTSLLADAQLDTFDPDAYFSRSHVRLASTREELPLLEALPAIKGQVVLEGESGLGKSMFLRMLISCSGRIVVYLPAAKCAAGVENAIQKKLQGPAQDANYLRSLVYAGAIDVVIDGLNEVSAKTHARITEFADTHFAGNILISTQPMEWMPPANARTFVLEPLERSQIRDFLLLHSKNLPPDAILSGTDYETACTTYLEGVLGDQDTETRVNVLQALSNPMDLTVIADMLARGKSPDLLRLREQQYEVMAADYRRRQNDKPFPLESFSERAYELRLADQDYFEPGEFVDELTRMQEHRLAITRPVRNEEGEQIAAWFFRHDKIMDYFLYQAFIGAHSDRQIAHLRDSRFRGVYLLLASNLPIDQAMALREILIKNAAKTKDHSLSDSFVLMLDQRSVA